VVRLAGGLAHDRLARRVALGLLGVELLVPARRCFRVRLG